VPSARCHWRDRGASSAVWVGLGGFVSATPKVEQVGTDSNCNRSGRPSYLAWFEVVPYPAYTINSEVRPGDLIFGSVRVLPGRVELRLEDRTRHWKFVRRISWPAPDLTSAEWIVEAPGTCVRFACTRPPLADFGSVDFDHVAAVAGGQTRRLTTRGSRVVGLRLVPVPQTGTLGMADQTGQSAPAFGSSDVSPGTAGATAGLPSAHGSAFTISWIADATVASGAESAS
jgi:hypothetical protein